MSNLDEFPDIARTAPYLDAICDVSLDFAGLCETEAALSWGDGPRYPLGFHTAGRCRRCGCTERRGCRNGRRGCWWTNMQATLCSRCASYPGRRRYRRRRLAALLPSLDWWQERRLWRHLARARGGHCCFEIDVDGEPVRVLGDSHMDAETREALKSVFRAAHAAAERGELPRSEE